MYQLTVQINPFQPPQLISFNRYIGYSFSVIRRSGSQGKAMDLTQKREFQELKFLCKGQVNSDTLAGWRAAKDGKKTPPDSYAEERKQEWLKGHDAYHNYCAIQIKQAAKKSVFDEGYNSYSKIRGKLLNPYPGSSSESYEFESGWRQAFRERSDKPYIPPKDPDKPQSFKERYSGSYGQSVTEPSAFKKDYKTGKYGE
ncbi:hypothetical protein [Neptuniibacter halophilus]|uniref:hypothetical protein n=1 Tax=Neptuniibacter halophilus TaxID=651666 RepID=UPI0025725487|nr:hypothetical protein [Neptuniibacter halophilus]